MNKLILGLTGTRMYENKAAIKAFIHKLKSKTDTTIEIVSLGDKNGADVYVKKYALEFGFIYKEMNPAHTVKNLYSLMTEAYYDKPYTPKNFHQQVKIFSQYVHSCVVFDNGKQDKKVVSVLNHLSKLKKNTVILAT